VPSPFERHGQIHKRADTSVERSERYRTGSAGAVNVTLPHSSSAEQSSDMAHV
jgi:hypothetical protein